MAGEEIKYNFPALSAAADSVNSASSKMTSELDNLKQGIAPLLATWSGDAQAAYYQRQNDWESAANDLRDLLGKIESALRQSAETMQAREKSNASKFGA